MPAGRDWSIACWWALPTLSMDSSLARRGKQQASGFRLDK